MSFLPVAFKQNQPRVYVNIWPRVCNMNTKLNVHKCRATQQRTQTRRWRMTPPTSRVTSLLSEEDVDRSSSRRPCTRLETSAPLCFKSFTFRVSSLQTCRFCLPVSQQKLFNRLEKLQKVFLFVFSCELFSLKPPGGLNPLESASSCRLSRVTGI